MQTLWQDVRYAVRVLAKNPGFSLVAILTLALGIGANTAIFSIVNSVLLRPLPFRDPGRLVQILETTEGKPYVSASGEDYFDWQARNHTLEASSITTWSQHYNASGAGEPETVSVIRAEANFFSVIGANPMLGAGFAPGDDQEGHDHVAVVSYGFWMRHFAGATDALGKKLALNAEPYTVVGVMPRGFNYPQGVDAWIPIDKTVKGTSARGNYSYRVIARLKPAVTVAQAQADLTAISGGLAAAYPDTNTGKSASVVPLQRRITQNSRPQLLVLLGAVALVLLVACANVANLTLSRATRREREMALRSALGGSGGRIVRQLLTESVLLSFTGAALGLIGAWWCVVLAQSVSWLPIPRTNAIRMDFAVLLFTLLISLLVGVLSGLAPALGARRMNLVEALKEGPRTAGGASGWRRKFRDALVVAELTTALALLVGAGLLLRTFASLRSADIGVRATNVMTMAFTLPQTSYATLPARHAFLDQLISRLQATPGMEQVALAQTLPLEGDHTWGSYPEGVADWRAASVPETVNFVSSDYFSVLGIPFRQGRNFTPQEYDQALEVSTKLTVFFKEHPNPGLTVHPEFATFAILSDAAAEALWPHQNPVGKVFISGNIPAHVVGVVGNVKTGGIRDAAGPQAYFPFTQELNNRFYPQEIVVKTHASPETTIGSIRAALRQLDAGIPLFNIRSMHQVVAENMEDTTLQTALLGAFAALALLLAAVGMYGVMSYLVAQRTREIGVRMALGAQPYQVLSMVLKRGARLAALGIAIGAAAAFALTRTIASLLFGVTPGDALTYTAAAAFLALIALLACYVPARRATRIDPLVALRYE